MGLQKVTVQPAYGAEHDFTIRDVLDVRVVDGGVLLVQRADATVLVREYVAATMELQEDA